MFYINAKLTIKLLQKFIGENKIKKYSNLSIGYKFYKLLIILLFFIIWIGGVFFLIILLDRNDKYIPIFLFYRVFFSMPLIFYLINWFIYILGKIVGFFDKIEEFHEKNDLPKFKQTQKDLLTIIIYLLPIYLLFILLLFIDLFGFDNLIFGLTFLLGVLVEILWIFIKLKRRK